jgi:pyruvate dehydrogenase E2 component (dihydrolipoamide acetyltransferase)
MASVVRMPSVLAGATEAAIANWLVGPGDSVAVGQPIAEIETEKALVEYEAEEAGVVGRLVLGAGDSGEIGDPILVLVADGETDADIDAALGRETPAAVAAPSSVASADADAAQANGHLAAPVVGSRGRLFASPLVRKIAGERGIDLAAIAGTGPNGRIVRRDLEQFLATQPSAPVLVPQGAGAEGEISPRRSEGLAAENLPRRPTLPAASTPADSIVPHTPMRRAIARRLTESKATIPHFYMVTECVVDELLELRKRINETAPVKISVNDFVVMAVAAAFRDVPEANVTWSDEGLVAHGSVDISIAVATEGGLVTPVLRGVDGKRLSDVARESQDLAQRARDRRLRQDELEGGTFSVSNLGMYGTLEFSAIINPPQSGILAVGAAKQQPVVTDGAITVATVMRCTLSVDHRAIDGALAARWLAAFTTRLEHPLAAIV